MSHPSILLLPLLFSYISFAHPIGSITPPNGYSSQYPLSTGGEALAFSEYRSPFVTFANIPHFDCFLAVNTSNERYDIAIFGAPFDTSTTGRLGARFGPNGIRLGSRRINTRFGWDPHTHNNSLRSWAKIVDYGDAPLTYLDNTTPRIITLGGDHTTILPALRSIKEIWGEAAVIHIDSHLDTWDPKIIGGTLSEYAGYNYGTFLSHTDSENLILNTSVHLSTRARVSNPRYDLNHDRSYGFLNILVRDIDSIRVDGVIKKIKGRVGKSKVYISVNIDVLDPTFALATGTAEPGGWITRELLRILEGLRGLRVIRADVVEVTPIYDNPGEITGLVAAKIALSLITLMVDTPVKN